MHRQLKSSVAASLLTHLLAWACVLGAVLSVSACGQKGPLTLPRADNAASAPAR